MSRFFVGQRVRPLFENLFDRSLRLSFWPRLPRKTKLPYPYRDTAHVTVKSTDCPHCNPTARAIRIVLARWVVAGIDKEED